MKIMAKSFNQLLKCTGGNLRIRGITIGITIGISRSKEGAQ